MSAQGYLVKRRRAIWLALLCIAMLAMAYLTAFFVVSFQKPVLLALPGGGAYDIIFKVVAAHKVTGLYNIGRIHSFNFATRPEKYYGDYECAALYKGHIFIFSGNSFSEYAGGMRVRAGHAPEGMEIMAALETRVMPAGDTGIDWQTVMKANPGGSLISVLLCVVRVARNEFKLAAFDGQRWHTCEKSIKCARNVDMFRMARIEAGLLVAWRELTEGEPAKEGSPRGLIFCSVFAGGEWGTVMPVESRAIREFALVEHDGGAWYFYPDVRLRTGRQINLVCKRQEADGRLGRSGRLTFLDKGRFMRYLSGFAAAGDADEVAFVFTMTGKVAMAVVPYNILGRDIVRPLRDVEGLPGTSNLLAWVLGSSILFMAAALIFLGVSLLVERLRPFERPPLPLLAYPVARWYRRAAAHAVDVALVMLPIMTALTAVFGVNIEDAHEAEWWVACAIAHVCFAGYCCLTELKWSRTVGKWMLGVMVLSADNASVSTGQVVGRNLVRLVDGLHMICLLGLLFMIATERSQRLGDLLVGTVVVMGKP